MKKTHCTMLLLASFFPCCGPLPQPRIDYFNYHNEHPKISDATLLPFGQIKTPDDALSAVEKSSEKALDLGIEPWRLLRAGHNEHWRRLSPLQAYYYDWLDFRKTKRRRVYPW